MQQRERGGLRAIGTREVPKVIQGSCGDDVGGVVVAGEWFAVSSFIVYLGMTLGGGLGHGYSEIHRQ